MGMNGRRQPGSNALQDQCRGPGEQECASSGCEECQQKERVERRGEERRAQGKVATSEHLSPLPRLKITSGVALVFKLRKEKR